MIYLVYYIHTFIILHKREMIESSSFHFVKYLKNFRVERREEKQEYEISSINNKFGIQDILKIYSRYI